VTESASPTERLAQLGLALPDQPPALPTFKPYVRTGFTVYTSGQIATRDGQLVASGRLGAEVDLDTGQEAARTCALNVLAQLSAAAGSLDCIAQLIKITVFVASAPGYTEQSQVANGASELFNDVLGDVVEHARSAIGVAALPLGTPVEVEAVALLTEPASMGRP
jgi:enamine deaminase RidA (YjgF/YER057c/UK114 family)